MKNKKYLSAVLVLSVLVGMLGGCANNNPPVAAPTPVAVVTSSPVQATSTPAPVKPTETPINELPVPTEAVPEHVHDYIVDVTDPTCTEYGIESGICECGDTYVVYTEPTGHSMSEFRHRKDSTTEEYGEDVAVCLVCEYEEINYLPLATPEPTQEPEATATPVPTATDTPVPTATNTPTPKPTATSTPKPTATNTPTPKPTKKPTSTPTPKATNTPTPMYTLAPTNTPTPVITDFPSKEAAVWSEREDRADGSYVTTRRFENTKYEVSMEYSDMDGATVYFNNGAIIAYDVPHKLSEESLKKFRMDIVNICYWCKNVEDAWNFLKDLGYVNHEPDMKGYVDKSSFYIHASREYDEMPIYSVYQRSNGERTVGSFGGR